MGIKVELVGWNKQAEVFDFNVYLDGGDDVVFSCDVQDGKVATVSENGKVDTVCLMDDLGYTEGEDELAAEIAEEKGYFELVEAFFVNQEIANADSTKTLYRYLGDIDRYDLSMEQEKAFINKCYELYQKEGFSKTYQSPYHQYKERNGQEFKVLAPISVDDVNFDLEVLPMWKIQFPDGAEIAAYPEEITSD